LEKQALKDVLKGIKENGYNTLHGVHPYQLSLVMMDNIGDIDCELRDELILSILARWIDRGVLSASEAYELLMISLDEEHILKKLGNIDDSVFVRTFSVEIVASVICKHRKEEFISDSDIQKALTPF
jgi:hypothetical protein